MRTWAEFYGDRFIVAAEVAKRLGKMVPLYIDMKYPKVDPDGRVVECLDGTPEFSTEEKVLAWEVEYAVRQKANKSRWGDLAAKFRRAQLHLVESPKGDPER